MIFVMLYLESNGNLTAAMLEKTLFDEKPLDQIPKQIFNGT